MSHLRNRGNRVTHAGRGTSDGLTLCGEKSTQRAKLGEVKQLDKVDIIESLNYETHLTWLDVAFPGRRCFFCNLLEPPYIFNGQLMTATAQHNHLDTITIQELIADGTQILEYRIGDQYAVDKARQFSARGGFEPPTFGL
jgi:hypothetical protein